MLIDTVLQKLRMSNTGLLAIFLVLVGVLSFFNIWLQFFTVPALGDGKVIALIMSNADLFPAPKYLVGMGMLRVVYAALAHMPALLQLLPADAPAQLGFIRVAGIVITLASGLFLLRVAKGQLRIVLVLTTPIWLLFSIGYIEYYPCIAGLFLAFLQWIFAQPLVNRPAFLMGVIGGIMPLIYAGFAPFVLIVMLFYLHAATWRQRGILIVAGLCAFITAVALFWHNGIFGFFDGLLKDLNLGEQNTIYSSYQGLSAGPHSIFFSVDYVFSVSHLRDVLMMILSGLGITGFCVLPLTFCLLQKGDAWNRQGMLGMCIVGWSIAYLLLMMPKLGPVQDLDLFFCSYLTMAFVTGMLFERYSPRAQTLLVFAWVASSAASMLYIFGLSA